MWFVLKGVVRLQTQPSVPAYRFNVFSTLSPQDSQDFYKLIYLQLKLAKLNPKVEVLYNDSLETTGRVHTTIFTHQAGNSAPSIQTVMTEVSVTVTQKNTPALINPPAPPSAFP